MPKIRPTGLAHCSETGCLRQQLGVPSGQRHEICRGLHAEQNAIIQAARFGTDIDGATIYVNTQPRVVCAKMLINAVGWDTRRLLYAQPLVEERSASHFPTPLCTRGRGYRIRRAAVSWAWPTRWPSAPHVCAAGWGLSS